MRELIDLFEAKRPVRPSRPTVANAVVKEAILTAARKLARPPLFLKTDRTWADMVMQKLEAKKAEMLSDPESGPFVPADEIVDIIDKMWPRFGGTFIDVRRDVEHEELSPGGYMTRTRERNGVDPSGDDVGQDVESSQWLTAMDKQAQVGSELSSMLSITDGNRMLNALHNLDTMLTYFADADPREGEEPALVEDMVNGLPKLIPLLMLIYGRDAS